MSTRLSAAADLLTLCESPESFSDQTIDTLFRDSILATGIESGSEQSLDLFERLRQSRAVLLAIEMLRYARNENRNTASARRRVMAMIDAELQEPA